MNEELAKRVEAGERLTADEVIPITGCNKNMNVIREAIAGDMNAALELLNTLLPGWGWNVRTMKGCVMHTANVFKNTFRPDAPKFGGKAKTPAAAIIAALLRALDKTPSN